MILKDAILTKDTVRTITFQLTAGECLVTRKEFTLTLDVSIYKSVATDVLSGAYGDLGKNMGTVPDILRYKCTAMLSSAARSLSKVASTIDLDENMEALWKVTVPT